MTVTTLLTAPEGVRRRAKLIGLAVRELARVEVAVRTRTLPDLCDRAGVDFHAFQSLEEPMAARPLPRHVAQVWWSLEVVLRWWPFARRRQCLRRALVLGRQISYLSPSLVLETVSLAPVEVHAVLLARGNRLDLGVLDRGSVRDAVPGGTTP